MNLTPDLKMRLRDRIRRNIVVDAAAGCWLWARRINNSGYGVMSIRIEGYRHPVKFFVHRVSYAVFKRTPAEGRVIAHSIRCVNPSCCNPEHLRATTQSANERDKKRAERWRKRQLREVPPPVHEFLEDLREAA